MSAAFIGHGSPTHALETNRFTSAWRDFGPRGAKPRYTQRRTTTHKFVMDAVGGCEQIWEQYVAKSP